MKISFSLSAVKDQAVQIASVALTAVQSAGRQITVIAANAYGKVSPFVLAGVAKIQSLNLSTLCATSKAVMKSPLGMGFGALAVAVGCIAFCKEPLQLSTRNISLAVAAMFSTVAAAVRFLKPALLGFVATKV